VTDRTGEPATGWPTLDAEITVDRSAGEVNALWDRFEVFEAMHHSQHLCNPLTEFEFDATVAAMGFDADHRVLDVACGPGEFLIRAHEAGVIGSLGVDLSPWMLQTAAGRARTRLAGTSRPNWLLADAAKLVPRRFDRVVCLGAEWVWHGMTGTVAALAERVEVGGRVAYGGPRLHFDADVASTTASFGRLETAEDVERRMRACGLRVRDRIDPGEAGWRAYLERGRYDAETWARRHPGPRADRWLADQAEWETRYEAEREIVGWSVWVADRVA